MSAPGPAGVRGARGGARRWPLLAAATVAFGCHKAPATPAGPECQTRADCAGGVAGGLLCQGGACVGCTRGRDCRLTELCDPVQRRCTLRPCFGDACQSHQDCALGLYCVQGLCLAPQKPASPGATCAVQVCTQDHDCNGGQRCNRRTYVCEQDLGCAAGAPCPAGQICNASSGACETACTPDTAQAVCGSFVPCKAGRCVQCIGDADCGPGLACDTAANVCKGPSACLTSRDCAVPKTCDRATQSCEDHRPPCTSNESCALDERCESRTGRCLPGACLADRLAPNGTQATAAPLAPGAYPQLTLCGSSEEDWFSLQLASGDTVQVVADADPIGSFDLQLVDATGAVLEEGPLSVEHLVGASGTYYLRARTNDASAFYGLDVQVAHGQACDHNPASPHPSPQQALPLSSGPLYGLAVCPGEATWFSARAAAGLSASLLADPTAGGPLVLQLYDSDGQTLLAQDASGAGQLAVSAPASKAGVFYLRVAGAAGWVRNRYDLTVRLASP